MNVLPKLCERYVLAHGNAVAHDVKVRPPKVDNFFVAHVLDIGIANIPLVRYRPIEYGSTRWYLKHLQCYVRSNFAQGLPYSVAGDTATDREDLRGEGEDFFAYILRQERRPKISPRVHLCLSVRSTTKFGHQRRTARVPGLGMTQIGIEDSVGQQPSDMPDALIPRTLELFQCQAG